MTKIKILISAALLFAPVFAGAQPMQDDDKNMAALLGGMVQSDSWIIRRDKAEEEFSGNVRYENDLYKIRADRGLSQRALRAYTLRGNVYAAREDETSKAHIKADKIFYNQARDTGYVLPQKGAQLELGYNIKNGGPAYRFYGDRLDFGAKFTSYKLSGWAELDDKDNALYSREMTFDLNTGIFEAYGGRPLLLGFNDDGDYAISADKITAYTGESRYSAQGRVQGWLAPAKGIKNLSGGFGGAGITAVR
ncbi:MAG: LptA/OstA family protein [Elusimicrobiota bacterium]|jgi:lipopolysaccharide export system protein LptA|nr:LptA/OstA family protein [Elusimicrobiota bacterium]